MEPLDSIHVLGTVVRPEESYNERQQLLSQLLHIRVKRYEHPDDVRKRSDHFETQYLRSRVYNLKQLVLILSVSFPPCERKYLNLTQYAINGEVGLIVVSLELRLSLPILINFFPDGFWHWRHP